jgi:hypothetical protein
MYLIAQPFDASVEQLKPASGPMIGWVVLRSGRWGRGSLSQVGISRHEQDDTVNANSALLLPASLLPCLLNLVVRNSSTGWQQGVRSGSKMRGVNLFAFLSSPVRIPQLD